MTGQLILWAVELGLVGLILGVWVLRTERARRRRMAESDAHWAAVRASDAARTAASDAEWAAERAAWDAAWEAERAAARAEWADMHARCDALEARLPPEDTAGRVEFVVVFPAGVPRERIDRALAAITREGGEVG